MIHTNSTTFHEKIHFGNTDVAIAIFSLDMLMVAPIIIGNTLVVLVYGTNKHLQTIANIPVINLAVTDLITGIVVIPLTCIVQYNSMNLSRHKYVCLFTMICTHITIGVSCLIHLIVALSRFAAVRFPFKHRAYSTKFQMIGILFFPWVYSTIVILIFILAFNNWSEEMAVCDMSLVMPSIYMEYCGSHLLAVLLVCTVIYSYLFIFILRYKNKIQVLYFIHEQMKRPPQDTSSEFSIRQNSITSTVSTRWRSEPHMQHQRALKMFVTVLVIYFLCWLPLLTKIMISTMYYNDLREPRWLFIFEQFALSILFLNSFMNPIIYGRMNSSFAQAFSRIIHVRQSRT